jgi:hypothetical protein
MDVKGMGRGGLAEKIVTFMDTIMNIRDPKNAGNLLFG